MTLALYGKSRRRQTTLIGLALASVLVAFAIGLIGSGRIQLVEAAPETIFSDSFGTAATTTVPAPWTDSDGGQSDARVIAGFSGAPSSHVLDLEEGENVHASVDSTGYTDVIVSFYCRGEGGNDDSDDLAVDYSTNGGTSWSNAATFDTNLSSGSDCRDDLWQTVTVDLSAVTAVDNNSNLRIRFRSIGHGSNNESVYVDEVVVTGEPNTTGTIRIEKDAQPNSSQPFEFSRSFGDNFTLEDDGSGSGWFTEFSGVTPGAHTVTELGELGWTLDSITCQDTMGGGSSGDKDTGIATIDISAGETVTCTFVNVEAVPDDDDNDGVPNDAPDVCPNTPPNWTGRVNTDGCAEIDLLHDFTTSQLPQNVCTGADFVFVLDKSGSIDSGEYTQLKDGISSFVNTYEGPGDGRYRLVTFGGTTADDESGGYVGKADLLTALGASSPGSSTTPTAAGIMLGDDLGVSGDRPDAPNIMFILTDGSPNRPGGDLNLGSTWVTGGNAAIDAANAARVTPSPGFHLIAIFVGAGDSNLPFNSTQDAEWTDAVMTALHGGPGYPNIGSFDPDAIASQLLAQSGCDELVITKTHDAGTDDEANAGDTVSYTITVTNNGTTTSPGSTVIDDLPGAGIVDWSTAADGCTITPDVPGDQVLQCDVPELAPFGEAGNSHTITVTGTIPNSHDVCGPYPNTAELYEDGNDPQAGNPDGESSAILTVANCPPPTGTVSGHKYNDLDGDGALDAPAEQGLQGWTIQLKDDTGAVVATTTTGSDGSYSFTGVAVGDYTVCELLESGWTNTAPLCSNKFGLAAGQDVTGVNFFNRQLGALQVTKTVDWNGVTPSAVTFSVCITGPSPSNTITCKNANQDGGILLFDDLVPGSYTISEVDPGDEWHVQVPGGPFTVVGGQTNQSSAAEVVNTRILPLTVTKTATPAWTRDIDWTIVKTVDDNEIDLLDNETHNSQYTITFTKTTVDTATITGTITITNPAANPVAASISAVTDAWNGNNATVTCPPLGQLAAGASIGCTYTMTVPAAGLPLNGINNIATAVTNGVVPGNSGTALVTWPAQPALELGSEPETITATDTLYGPIPGSFSTSGSFNYPILQSCDGVQYDGNGEGSKQVVNTAEIVETDDESSQTVTINCTQRRGSITVTKLIDWAGTVNPGSDTFTVCIDGPGPNGVNDACSPALGHNGQYTFTSLVPGLYAITESHGAQWVASLPADVDLQPAGSPSVNVTNTYRPGSLTVTKNVNLGGAAAAAAGANADGEVTFQVCATGPNGFANCQNITIDLDDTNTGTATWNNLYAGSYSVTETAPAAIWTTTDNSGNPDDRTVSGTVSAGANTSAGTFTNTLKKGSLEITKTFAWNGVPATHQPSVAFQACISGPSYPIGNEAGACQVVTNATVTLTWTDLVPGDYTLRELQSVGGQPVDDLDAWEVTINPDGDVLVAANAEAAASIDNEYQLGAITITKTVNWGQQDEDETQTFEICIQLLLQGQPADGHDPICDTAGFNGGDLSFTGLIPGTYTVTESDPGAEWAISGSGVNVVAPAGNTGSSTVTNTILEGDLNVSKTFNWNGAPVDDGQYMTICIQGPSYPIGDEAGACTTVTPSSTLATWEDLEVGDYTVTETFPQGDQDEWTTTVDGVPSTSGSATVSSEGDPALVNITNTLKRATIVVRKIYDVDEQDPDESWRPGILVGDQAATPVAADLGLWEPVDVAANTEIEVTELLPDGWRNTGIQFSDGCIVATPEDIANDLLSLALNIIGIDIQLALEVSADTVSVAPGSTCEVTFTNEPYGTVRVVKVDNSVNGNAWDFNLSGTAAIDGDSDTDQDFAFTGSDQATFQVPLGTYDANETTAGVFASFDECPVLSNEAGEGIYMVKSPSGPQVIDQPGEEMVFTITNNDCPVVLASGALYLAKWHDLDGDGERDGNEPGIANWPITVTGPQFPTGQTFLTDGNGEYNGLNGIFAGFYTVTEGSRSGFYQSGLIVNGEEQDPVAATVVVEVKDFAIGDEPDPDIFTFVAFGNRELGSIRIVKNVTDQVGNVGRGGWLFQLTGGCDGIATSGVTNAAGVLVFEDLEPTDICDVPYLVTESAANQDGFITSPASGVASAEVDAGDETTVTFTNSRGTTVTVDPTPTNTLVPTSTPTATSTPSPTATDTPTPVSTVAGEITPGPGAIATPIAPDTGSGFGGPTNNSLVLLLGLAILTAGAGLISLARRKA